ncbi:3707_t:CDS:2, partial [Paraglomus brasilianum]
YSATQRTASFLQPHPPVYPNLQQNANNSTTMQASSTRNTLPPISIPPPQPASLQSQATLPQSSPDSSSKTTRSRWTPEEDNLLRLTVTIFGDRPECWAKIAAFIPERSNKDCRKRWFHSLDPTLRKGPWTTEEDEILRKNVERYPNSWSKIAKSIPGRTDDQCAKRWRESLDPMIDRREWSSEEDKLLIEKYELFGGQWQEISKYFPGRPGLHCRNRWRKLQRRLVRQQIRVKNFKGVNINRKGSKNSEENDINDEDTGVQSSSSSTISTSIIDSTALTPSPTTATTTGNLTPIISPQLSSLHQHFAPHTSSLPSPSSLPPSQPLPPITIDVDMQMQLSLLGVQISISENDQLDQSASAAMNIDREEERGGVNQEEQDRQRRQISQQARQQNQIQHHDHIDNHPHINNQLSRPPQQASASRNLSIAALISPANDLGFVIRDPLHDSLNQTEVIGEDGGSESTGSDAWRMGGVVDRGPDLNSNAELRNASAYGQEAQMEAITHVPSTTVRQFPIVSLQSISNYLASNPNAHRAGIHASIQTSQSAMVSGTARDIIPNNEAIRKSSSERSTIQSVRNLIDHNLTFQEDTGLVAVDGSTEMSTDVTSTAKSKNSEHCGKLRKNKNVSDEVSVDEEGGKGGNMEEDEERPYKYGESNPDSNLDRNTASNGNKVSKISYPTTLTTIATSSPTIPSSSRRSLTTISLYDIIQQDLPPTPHDATTIIAQHSNSHSNHAHNGHSIFSLYSCDVNGCGGRFNNRSELCNHTRHVHPHLDVILNNSINAALTSGENVMGDGFWKCS